MRLIDEFGIDTKLAVKMCMDIADLLSATDTNMSTYTAAIGLFLKLAIEGTVEEAQKINKSYKYEHGKKIAMSIIESIIDKEAVLAKKETTDDRKDM